MLTAYTRLKDILATTETKLLAISGADASVKLDVLKWSKKEILGHLIDSASNNHQRFVRMQIENNTSLPKYRQNEWVEVQHWQQKDWKDIIAFWQLFNEHILHIFNHVDASTLQNTIVLGTTPFTLQFIIDDYVDHMEHHLMQIFGE